MKKILLLVLGTAVLGGICFSAPAVNVLNYKGGNTIPVTATIEDKTYLDTLVVGSGVATIFPTLISGTQTYTTQSQWQTLSSTYIDSLYLVDYVGINTRVAQGMGAYAAGTITSAVMGMVSTDTITPYFFSVTFNESQSTVAGTQETITYWYRSGTDSPPTGAWISLTDAAQVYCKDPYLQWQARLTTSESNTLTPILQRANLKYDSYYDCGFKIYFIGVSNDNSVDSTYLSIYDGAAGNARFFINNRSGNNNPWVLPSPLVINDTSTIYVGSGMRAYIQYLPK